MSTRSRIAIKNEDGTISSIYCHFDGYPEHNGRILHEHYRDVEKVKKLISLGDLSSLGENIGKRHDFNETPEGQCNFYGRDRGEKNTDYKNHSTLKDLVKTAEDSWGEWIYLFEDGNWKVCDTHSRVKIFNPLDSVMKAIS